MRKAVVYYKDIPAGMLTEVEEDEMYRFQYIPSYLSRSDAHAISLSLPLTDVPYEREILFPFFDGLIPEGWLLDVAIRNLDISVLDRMSLLLLCCRDCIGAVSVIETEVDYV